MAWKKTHSEYCSMIRTARKALRFMINWPADKLISFYSTSEEGKAITSNGKYYKWLEQFTWHLAYFQAVFPFRIKQKILYIDDFLKTFFPNLFNKYCSLINRS